MKSQTNPSQVAQHWTEADPQIAQSVELADGALT